MWRSKSVEPPDLVIECHWFTACVLFCFSLPPAFACHHSPQLRPGSPKRDGGGGSGPRSHPRDNSCLATAYDDIRDSLVRLGWCDDVERKARKARKEKYLCG